MAGSFLAELKRRKVTRAAVTYVVVAWALLQVGDVVIEPLGLPVWVQTALIMGLAALFPVVVVVAWLYELTSSGLVRDSADVDAEDAKSHRALEKPRIAVLPLDHLGPEEDSWHLGEGVAEEILNVIARSPGLQVIARTSSFRFQGEEARLDNLRRQLGVSHVLTGSLRLSDERIRVSVQLVQVADEQQLWADSFQRGKQDLFQLQNEIARSVGKDVLAALGLDSVATRREWKLAPAAYEQYLMAMAAFRRGDFPQALKYAEASAGIDEDNPLVPSLMAEVYLNWPRYGFVLGLDELTQARRHARRALEVDPDYLPASAALGMLSLYLSRDFAAAFDAVVKAAIDQPGLVEWLPVLLAYANRYEDAVEVQRRVALQDPLNTVNLLTWANRLNWLGRRDQALQICDRARELDPNHMILANNDYRWSIRDGNFEKARGLLRQWGLDPDRPASERTRSFLPRSIGLWLGARLYGEMGDLDTALHLAREIEKEEGFTPTTVAEAYICAGAVDDAYRIWDLGITRYDSGVYDLARPENMRDPDNHFWKSFECDPRFEEYLGRLGIDEAALQGIDWHQVDRVLA